MSFWSAGAQSVLGKKPLVSGIRSFCTRDAGIEDRQKYGDWNAPVWTGQEWKAAESDSFKINHYIYIYLYKTGIYTIPETVYRQEPEYKMDPSGDFILYIKDIFTLFSIKADREVRLNEIE